MRSEFRPLGRWRPEGEAMGEVCREFGILRKTGYKIFDRNKVHGLEALSDRIPASGALRQPLPPQIESLITACKREKPHWGARKIRELLVRKLDGDFRVPAKSTIHAVLCRHDLMKPIGLPRHRATGTGRRGRARRSHVKGEWPSTDRCSGWRK